MNTAPLNGATLDGLGSVVLAAAFVPPTYLTAVVAMAPPLIDTDLTTVTNA